MIIDVQNITKRYAGKTAVDGVSFQVEQGEIVGFLGPNGAGKSTTMRILAGYLPATAGRALVCGHDVYRNSLEARRCVGYMPENVPLYTDMRVKEYLKFRGALKGLGGKRLLIRTERVMELCGLRDVRRKMIGSLSKGYRQRVGLADAIIHEPPLLILDEPTNGLDPNQIRQVRELIKELGRRHTVLLSTHILSEVEATCQRVIIIHNGEIKASGQPDELVRGMRQAGAVRVELHCGEEDPIPLLEKVTGVRKVVLEAEDDGWQTLLLRVEANIDSREAVAALAAKHQWRLRNLSNQQNRLEDVFVELTTGSR